MKKVTIKSFEELVEVFPMMTNKQIMNLYKQALSVISFYNEYIGQENTCEEKVLEYLERLTPYVEVRDFLAGYLAQCYCVEHGTPID